MRRRSKIALVMVVALLAGFVLADAIATVVLERRLAARITQAAATPVGVELEGWPAAVRLLLGGLPRANAENAGGADGTSPLRTLAARVDDLDVAAASLVDGHRPLSFTGRRLHLAVTFRQEAAPLGMSRLEIGLDDLVGSLDRGAGRSLVTASEARLTAENLSLPDSPATLASFRARLGSTRMTRVEGQRAPSILVESPSASFEALLTEDEVNRIWTYPGHVLLLPGVTRLTLGPVTVDVDVHVADGKVVLAPRVPPQLRPLVGEAPHLSFVPALPLGAEMQGVEVRQGDLVLRGSATRVEVPLPAAPP
ncbi:MAG: hypothetical protein ABR592_00945 [Nitriliruptorales bacterium]